MINPNSVLNRLPVVYCNDDTGVITVADTTNDSILGLSDYQGTNYRTSELVEVERLNSDLDPLLYLVLSGFINAYKFKVYCVEGQYLVIYSCYKTLTCAMEIQVHPKITDIDLDLTPAQVTLHQRLMDSAQFITYTLGRNGWFLTPTDEEFVSAKRSINRTSDGLYHNSIMQYQYSTFIEVDYGNIYRHLKPIDVYESSRPYVDGGKIIPTLTRLGYEIKTDIRNPEVYYAIDPGTGTAVQFELPISPQISAKHHDDIAKRYSLSGGLVIRVPNQSLVGTDISFLGKLTRIEDRLSVPQTPQNRLVLSMVEEIDKLAPRQGYYLLSPTNGIFIYCKWYQNHIFITDPEFKYAGITLREHCKQQGFI